MTCISPPGGSGVTQPAPLGLRGGTLDPPAARAPCCHAESAREWHKISPKEAQHTSRDQIRVGVRLLEVVRAAHYAVRLPPMRTRPEREAQLLRVFAVLGYLPEVPGCPAEPKTQKQSVGLVLSQSIVYSRAYLIQPISSPIANLLERKWTLSRQ